MNVHINYQFNFGNNIVIREQEGTAVEFEILLQALEHLLNQISANSLKDTIFKLLMEYLMKHGESSKRELKEVYDLLEFLKIMAEFQGLKPLEIGT